MGTIDSMKDTQVIIRFIPYYIPSNQDEPLLISFELLLQVRQHIQATSFFYLPLSTCQLYVSYVSYLQLQLMIILITKQPRKTLRTCRRHKSAKAAKSQTKAAAFRGSERPSSARAKNDAFELSMKPTRMPV